MKSESKHLSKSEARRFLVNYQGLNDICDYQETAGVLSYIGKVGCIQYDPLNVIGRNADLVLQSRVENYKPSILEDLLYKERSLIDGWDKMMAIYSSSDWPYFKRLRKERVLEIEFALGHRNSLRALEHLDEVKAIVAKEGPLQSNKIDIGSENPGSWGHRKLSSVALDYLFNVGELGIHSKKNTQKVYDLIENLLPEEVLLQEPFDTDDEFYQWYVYRRLGSIGLLWERNMGGWLGHFISNSKIRNPMLQNLLSEGEIEQFFIEDMKQPFYIRKKDLGYLNSKPKNDSVRFLAPLDNLLWDRLLIKTIFDFEYSWEVYTPVAKRKYGYYVLPVLYNDCFVARFEPEIYRGESEVRIKNWWWEPNITVNEKLIYDLKEGFQRFCRFLGAEKVNEKDFASKCVK